MLGEVVEGRKFSIPEALPFDPLTSCPLTPSLSSQSQPQSLASSSPSMTITGKQQKKKNLRCPRCNSSNTKFCYYNNYNLSQPRHFCKTCRRYWTKGGVLRNVPIGGRCRKTKTALSITATGSGGSSGSRPTETANPQLPSPSSDHSASIGMAAKVDDHPPSCPALWPSPRTSHLMGPRDISVQNPNPNYSRSLNINSIRFKEDAVVLGAAMAAKPAAAFPACGPSMVPLGQLLIRTPLWSNGSRLTHQQHQSKSQWQQQQHCNTLLSDHMPSSRCLKPRFEPSGNHYDSQLLSVMRAVDCFESCSSTTTTTNTAVAEATISVMQSLPFSIGEFSYRNPAFSGSDQPPTNEALP